MKKTLFLTVCAALFALASCEKQPLGAPDTPDCNPITFNLSATHPGGAGTKAAVKADWEEGDAIFVFFSGADAPKYLKMTYTGGSWVNKEYDGATQTDGALGLSDGDNGTMRAVFLPFSSAATVVKDGSDNFQFSTGACCYYLTDTQSYAVSGGVITGTFSMALPDGFMLFYYEDASAADDMAALSVSGFIPTTVGSIAPATLAITETQLAEGSVMPGYAYGGGYLFGGVCKAEARNTATAFDLLLSKCLTYTAARSAETLIDPTGTNSRTIDITRMDASGATAWAATDKPQVVDLGLSVQWASRPLGATNANPYGDYYAWGDLVPYYKEGKNPQGDLSNASNWRSGKTTGYTWTSYKFDNSSAHNGSSFSKYKGNDYITLQAEDDVAQQSSATIGAGWRMPTKSEMTLLYNAMGNAAYTTRWCDGTDGKQYRGSTAVKGIEIKHNATGVTLFLPAAGGRDGLGLEFLDMAGLYWSSSLWKSDLQESWCLVFTSEEWGVEAYGRCDGFPVCPVRE